MKLVVAIPNFKGVHMYEQPLPKGDASTDATIAVMRAVVHSCVDSGPVYKAIQPLVKNFDKSSSNHHRAHQLATYVYSFMMKHFLFKPDPQAAEFLQHPDILLRKINRDGQAAADCDDLAMMAAAMCMLGIYHMEIQATPILAVIGIRLNRPFQHVFYGMTFDRSAPTIRNSIFGDPQERVPPGGIHPAARKLKLYTV